mmetsp:Transcript_54546/g.137716  ORF Transcript_54546/g.137716 Transcript_54546/m.137716 type:complete len:251 (+) Transcript_54546:1220-1972(+)
MTLPNSLLEKSCHFFIGTSMRPEWGPSAPPTRPMTRAMYSFCIRWFEFCVVKWRKASQDLPKICTPLVWLSRRWQMPRCRGSVALGISKRRCATWMKFVGDSSHSPRWSVTTNMPAGLQTATKWSDSASFCTSHHWLAGGAPAVMDTSGVMGRSKHSDSTSPRHQKGFSSTSSSSHHVFSSCLEAPLPPPLPLPPLPLPPLPPPLPSGRVTMSPCSTLRTCSRCSWKWHLPKRKSSWSLRRNPRTASWQP